MNSLFVLFTSSIIIRSQESLSSLKTIDYFSRYTLYLNSFLLKGKGVFGFVWILSPVVIFSYEKVMENATQTSEQGLVLVLILKF